jgi:phosphoglucomutase/phosphomannomutase
MPKKGGFIKSIETTELFRAIAEAYGGVCFDVLTGFKYISALIQKWEQDPDGYEYIFGGEESCGYLLGTHSRDKDAVISSALICEMALHAKMQGKTPIDLLHEIYRKFGVYYEKLLAIKFEDSKEDKERAAEGIRKLRISPPRNILGIDVEFIEDYRTSVRTYLKTGETEPLFFPASNVILFRLADGSKLMIRPSGTEPKIKIYSGVCLKEFAGIPEALKKCEIHAAELIDAIKSLIVA